jgi:DNA-binding NtrC family response regulator
MNPRILIHCLGQTRQALKRVFDAGGVPQHLLHWTHMPLEAIALAHHRDETFDFLIIDARSPLAFLCCDMLKAASPKSQIIFLSSYEDLQLRLQCVQYNCVAFFKMPEEIDSLTPLIYCLLEQ